jgi:hypothetical protein
MADFCNAMGFSLQEIVHDAKSRDFIDASRLMTQYGKCCHAFLKMKQGIRNKEDHKGNLREGLVSIIYSVKDYTNLTLEDICETVWDRVSQRDWQKNPDSANEELL